MDDIAVMGVATVVIGIPAVAAVLAILTAFLGALLLDRRKMLLASGYILACTAAAFVTDTLWTGSSMPASNPVPWIVAVAVFVFVVVLLVSRRGVKVISDLESQRVEFMGGIVHDLRNPLTGVIGAATVLYEQARSWAKKRQQKWSG